MFRPRAASSPSRTALASKQAGAGAGAPEDGQTETDKPKPSLKATAVRMLARREYGRAELAAKLIAKGAPRDEADGVLDELERLGYLSDARFANAVVAHKSGQYGKRAIVHALKERRVEPSAARDALRALEGVDELAGATALWQRRFGTPPRDEREKARQVRFLLARGYGMSVALKVLRAAGAPVADDTGDADPG